VQLDLTDAETLALLNLLVETIEADRYPLSPRIRLLQGPNVAKCDEIGGLPPQLAARLRRNAPPPPARLPTADERDPGGRRAWESGGGEAVASVRLVSASRTNHTLGTRFGGRLATQSRP